MKRTTTILLIVAMAMALLTGCGKPTAQPADVVVDASAPANDQPAAPEASQTAAHNWSESNAVDDSFSFQFEWQVTCNCDGGYEHFIREELPA